MHAMSVTASQIAGALCRCADSLFNTTTTDGSSVLALDAASVVPPSLMKPLKR
jgi:hypothetical protein